MIRLIIAAFAVAFSVSVAQAQGQCAPRFLISHNLEVKHQEQHQFTFIEGETLFEVWLNSESGTWTFLRTNLDGMSCVIAAGKGVVVGLVNPPGEDL